MSLPAYSQYVQTGVAWIGEIPSHWAVKPLLGSVVERKRKNRGMVEDNLLSLSYGKIIPKDIETMDGLLPESFESYHIVRKGDIVFRLTDLQNDKRSLRSAIVEEDGIITSAYLAVEPIREHSPFMNYLFRAYDTAKVFYSMGGGLRQSMKFSDLKRMPTIIPPLGEQKAISSFLDMETSKIDGLVSEQRRLIELLKEKRQAVISHAVTKGLNPSGPMKSSGVEWLGDIPQHWTVKRLKHTSPTVTVGIVVNPSTFFSEHGLPFIHATNISDGHIDWKRAKKISTAASNIHAKTRLAVGDLLTIRVGATRGITAVVPPECDGGNCASVVLIRAGDFNSNWLCFAMNSAVVQHQIDVVAYGAAQPCFNISDAEDFWIPVADREEQDNIADYLSRSTTAFNDLISKAESATGLLQERRTALISAAVTGKIDVRNRALRKSA